MGSRRWLDAFSHPHGQVIVVRLSLSCALGPLVEHGEKLAHPFVKPLTFALLLLLAACFLQLPLFALGDYFVQQLLARLLPLELKVGQHKYFQLSSFCYLQTTSQSKCETQDLCQVIEEGLVLPFAVCFAA